MSCRVKTVRYPGGKREPGESAEAALARELLEELGVRVTVGAPLITVPQQYPHKRLRLDVRRITAWQGTPRGHEGQALAWVPPHMLASYAMPPADRPVVAALVQPDRYLVTPPPGDATSWLSDLQASLDAGMRRVQLRAPSIDSGDFRPLARLAVERCRVAGVGAGKYPWQIIVARHRSSNLASDEQQRIESTESADGSDCGNDYGRGRAPSRCDGLREGRSAR